MSLCEEEEEKIVDIAFSGKEKKKSSNGVMEQLGAGVESDVANKNSGGAAQEEGDLDKKQGIENTIAESAAAKRKKKKKKKKEEEEEAAMEVSEAKDEKPIGYVKVKRVPKQVREMQEALARRREAEEKAKREEEEKQRREEEEWQRAEELERQAEEARRRKKEREKEKLHQKRLEGKILTTKQKEEARRRQAMRDQFLSNSGGSLLNTTVPATNKPFYHQKKKTMPMPQPVEKETRPDTVAEAATDSVDSVMIEESGLIDTEAQSEVCEFVDGSGVEEEEGDEWDTKSWDGANLLVSTSADDEVESVREPVAKKGASSSSSPNAENRTIQSQRDVEKLADHPLVPNKRNTNAASVLALKKEMRNSSDTAPPKRKEGEETLLRSPICCIMGHVDAGKTTLLDCIRGTDVQGGEAGGITQQIGATYFPTENIRQRTRELKSDAVLKVPGLLVIDTPGHKLFANLRSQGAGLCDVAILVVDIMDDELKPQTKEALNLLKMRNTSFIVALNKVDRLYGWKPSCNAPIKKTLNLQSRDVQLEFKTRLTKIITLFKEQGLNTGLYFKKPETVFIDIVPTSANTGEGIPDLLLLLVNLTQRTMVEKITFRNKVQCTVLDVKVVEGRGVTIDVVLVNGVLHEGDQIVVCGVQEPIVTTIRALLTPQSMKELCVKGSYLRQKEIKAAHCIKISAKGLEHAVSGTDLYVVKPTDSLEDIKERVMEDIKAVWRMIDKSGEGVYAQASSPGLLWVLLEFLKTDVKIPVSGLSIGSVHMRDVNKASAMLKKKKKEFAVILAFDVKVTTEARHRAKGLGVKIFTGDVIFHLFDQFKAYIGHIKEAKKKEVADETVFPCKLEILPKGIIHKNDPIILGVVVLAGIVKVGTPICVPSMNFLDIGRIASIESNGKSVDTAKKGQEIAIKIVGAHEQQKSFQRQDVLVSVMSRRSIDILKQFYKGDHLFSVDWGLVIELKNLLKIK